ncbi:MAG TPA: DMT family transporter [Steroidobacteraceae bacterium]|jgi:drug/metabolite transporter (DMT)-like permease
MPSSSEQQSVHRTRGRTQILLFAVLALFAFAGNSLLCRAALKYTSIDPATFTSVRIAAGAIVLLVIFRMRGGKVAATGSWVSALALFIYAIAFSFAYVSLAAGTGALLLFGAVQATMIGYGLWSGERLHAVQIAGLVSALCGLAGLLLPGISAPPLSGSLLMLAAGVAWGIYSLRGKRAGDPIGVTAGNFMRAVPFAMALSLAAMRWIRIDYAGVAYAVASGAITSALGYAIWYTALPSLRATSAAAIQLSVPVMTAAAGVLFLGEALTLRLLIASAVILGGIALVVLNSGKQRTGV